MPDWGVILSVAFVVALPGAFVFAIRETRRRERTRVRNAIMHLWYEDAIDDETVGILVRRTS